MICSESKTLILMARTVRCSVLALAVLLLSHSVSAKSASQVQLLTQSIRKMATESKLRSIAVADLVAKSGNASPEGLYFSDLIHLYLDEPPKKWSMIHRDAVSSFLRAHKMEPLDVRARDVIQQLGEVLRTDAILTGDVNAGPENFVIDLSLVRVSDGGVIGTATAVIPADPFYRSLQTYPTPPKVSEIVPLPTKGVHAAEPLDFPAPQFRGPADAKSEGTGGVTRVLLQFTISAEGRIASVRVNKESAVEFAEIAWRSCRAWRFKPAVDRTGAPVATQFLLDVMFRFN
jgi:TonB family protein